MMHSVMMKTIVLDAIGMVEHAVTILFIAGINIAQVSDDQILTFLLNYSIYFVYFRISSLSNDSILEL